MRAEDHARELIKDMLDAAVACTFLFRRRDEIITGVKDPEIAVEYSAELDLVNAAIESMEDRGKTAQGELIALVKALSGSSTDGGEQQ